MSLLTTKLGVYVGNDASSLQQFETWLGAPVDTVLGYTAGSSWAALDPGWQIGMSQYLGGTGRQINWSMPMTPDGTGVAAMREAAAGLHNVDYTRWAQEILASRTTDTDPIYVRTAWELGGSWFHWTADAKQDPAAFIGAFQQFAKSFHGVSDRFEIVWDVAGDQGPVEQWYPGDQAVDVISQDVYWYPQWQGADPESAFDVVVNGSARGLAWLSNFAGQHGKQLAVAEWGVPGAVGSTVDGAKWISLMKNWIDTHDVAYANYWNGELASGYDGKLSDGDPAAAAAGLRDFFTSPVSQLPNPTGPADNLHQPIALQAGVGPDSMVLKISQDFYLENARYTVAVDGVKIGATFSASALHGSGADDILTLQGAWGPGAHTVVVNFLNDAWGGSVAADRNLYVDGLSYNGIAQQGGVASVLSSGPKSLAVAASGVTLTGTAGADRLVGTANGDVLSGGAGNDMVIGGKGNDMLTGGTGYDQFSLNIGDGSDTITDFKSGADKLQFHGVTAAQATTAAAIHAGVAGLDVSYGIGSSVFLVGVSKIVATDMAFV